MLIGVQRAGFVSFPISSRNSPSAVAHLLTKTSSEYLVVGPEQSLQDLAAAAFHLMQEAGGSIPHKMQMPVFENLYLSEAGAPFVPLPPLNADLDEPTVMMHSSGSTAFPKPITWTKYRQLMSGRIPCTPTVCLSLESTLLIFSYRRSWRAGLNRHEVRMPHSGDLPCHGHPSDMLFGTCTNNFIFFLSDSRASPASGIS